MADKVPDTDTLSVAALAIAWEIVQKCHFIDLNDPPPAEEIQRILTNAVVDTHRAIFNYQHLDEK